MKEKKRSGVFHDRLGRPREFIVDSSPNCFAILITQSSLPNGRPRCALDRRSSRFSVRFVHDFNPVLRSLHWPLTQNVRWLSVIQQKLSQTGPLPLLGHVHRHFSGLVFSASHPLKELLPRYPRRMTQRSGATTSPYLHSHCGS